MARLALPMSATPPLPGTMSLDEAIRQIRLDPALGDLVRDAYLGRDVRDSADRFAASSEWAEVNRLLDGRIRGATVVDLGAGTGIASAAFSGSGAARVFAIEPDPSDEVGRGAVSRLGMGPEVEVVAAVGEAIPLPDGVADIVYCRQVLHHATDLESMVTEMARVLRLGGVLMACREHVVDDEGQLRAFLDAHPVHRLAGGENAYPLGRYQSAIEAAGLRLVQTFGPWDSVINAFPLAQTPEDLANLEAVALRRRFGAIGNLASRVPPVTWSVRQLMRRQPGRLYTFLATKSPTR